MPVMKQNDYSMENLTAGLRRFYETPAPVPPRCSRARRDWLIFQHNIKKLSDEELFLLCYLEELDGNRSMTDLFGHEITARGFTYADYTAFLKSKGLPTLAEVIAEEKTADQAKKTPSKKAERKIA
jgi:hypothetical protein